MKELERRISVESETIKYAVIFDRPSADSVFLVLMNREIIGAEDKKNNIHQR